MTPGCPQSTWSCCCSSFNCSACGYGTLTCSPEVLPCPGPAVFDSLSLPHLSTSECLAMKSQLTFTPEVLTTLYNHCDYYLTLLVIYKRLNILKNNLALAAIYSYNLHPAQLEEGWPTLTAWFLSRFLPRFPPFLGSFS